MNPAQDVAWRLKVDSDHAITSREKTVHDPYASTHPNTALLYGAS